MVDACRHAGSGSPMRLNDSATSAWVWKALGCAIVVIGGLYVMGWVLGGMLGPLRMLGQSVTCQSNIFRVARAFRLYADDYEDHFPPAAEWMDRTAFFVVEERRFHCPAVSKEGEIRFGYAMNSKLAGALKGTLANADQTPLLYDSTDGRRSAFDPFASLPRPGRHLTRARKDTPSRRGNFVGYAGGNARIRLDPRQPSVP